MSGKKGMKHYPQSIKNEIILHYQNGRSVCALSREYGISRYSIQSWCSLRPEVNNRQMLPLKKGKPRKQTITAQQELELKIKRLEMENKLLRDFRYELGRG